MSRIYDAMNRALGKTQHTVPSRVPTTPVRHRLVDPVGEPYHEMVRAIVALTATQRSKMILVVSAIHGEGASTVARNLAKVLGRNGSEGVLLELETIDEG